MVTPTSFQIIVMSLPVGESHEIVRNASRIINTQITRLSQEITRKSLDHIILTEREVVELKFTPSEGLTSVQAEELLKKWGRNELIEKQVPTWLVIFHLVHLLFFIVMKCRKYCN